MQAPREKGLSLTRKLYKSRTLGLVLGFFCVAVAIYPLERPTWVWTLLVLNGFVWSHLAFHWARLSKTPYRAEKRNLLIDSFLGGFWVGAMQFNVLSSVTSLSMLTMNNIANGGLRFLLVGALAQLSGVAVSMLVFVPVFSPESTALQTYACIPLLALYPMALGWIAYQQAHLLSKHKRELLALSRTDSLSGLMNHGSWKDHLDIEFQRCSRSHQSATIAVIDIDHFKTINDTYGHVVGDDVLRQLSQVIKQNLRVSDLAGRYGGDEFCVILPHTPVTIAADIMDRLRDTFSATQYEREPMMRVSLSIGLAAYSPSQVDATGWLDEADKALYEAKSTGRNRISLSVDGAFQPAVRASA